VGVVRGIGMLALLLGAAGLLTRFGGKSMKGYPGPYASKSFWRGAGRLGVVLVAVGVLLILVSVL
jgi:hypothetical protein